MGGKPSTAQTSSTYPSSCLGRTTLMLRRHGTRMGCPQTRRASRLAVWLLRATLATARTSLTATSGPASRRAVPGLRHLLAHPSTLPTPRFSRSRPPTGLLRPMCSITLTWLTSILLPTGLPTPRPTWTVLLLRTSAVVTQTLCPCPSTGGLRSPTPQLLMALTLVQTHNPYYSYRAGYPGRHQHHLHSGRAAVHCQDYPGSSYARQRHGRFHKACSGYHDAREEPHERLLEIRIMGDLGCR